MNDDLHARAARFAALGDPARLAIVDELASSDRAPVELQHRVGISSNLLAHHLGVLESAGIVDRARSSGDGRRRYVHLVADAFDGVTPAVPYDASRVLFVCTHNSARSQLAAALWRARTGRRAASAGTHPADRVHPGAVAAARRAGLDLGDAQPRALDPTTSDDLVVTVCDRAHEELPYDPDRLHWSVPDPVPSGRAAAFDAVVAELHRRIDTLTSAA